jgi:outer membrane protein TolC
VNRVADFTEYDISLTRPVRLPGKAGLDRKAGDAGVRAADNMADDARHQAAISLSEHWWDWLGAAAERRVLDSSAETLRQAVVAVGRRRALRDAASMELEQAEAALATARAAARAAAGREAAARAALMAQFPDLPLPAAAPAMPAPVLPPEGLATLGVLVAQRSHEIGAAIAQAEMASLLAERARRERIPDPSVGVRGFSEFGGAEQGVGVLISVPIGGRHRRALADQAAAEAQASSAQATMIRHDIESLAGRDVAAAEAGFAAWEEALLARTRSHAASTRAARGHALGGLDLSERLYAERVAQEAALAEALARAEAWRAITRLRIDSHTLWMHPEESTVDAHAAGARR